MGSIGVLLAQKLFASIDFPEGFFPLMKIKMSKEMKFLFRSKLSWQWNASIQLVVIFNAQLLQYESKLYY